MIHISGIKRLGDAFNVGNVSLRGKFTMNKSISWLAVMGIGFLLMVFSSFNGKPTKSTNSWENTVMYIGKESPNTKPLGVEYVERPVRLLPITNRGRVFAQLTSNFDSEIERSYHIRFREKLILYPEIATDLTNEMLEWGRLGRPDTNEVVAGPCVSTKDRITIDGRAFKVVGQLRKSVGLFANSYLICGDTITSELFNINNEAVMYAYFLQLSTQPLHNLEMNQKLIEAFPNSQFVAYTQFVRVEPALFYLSIVGMLLLLLGGSFVFYNLYGILGNHFSNNWLRLPLLEIGRHKHLFLSVHLFYFGTVLLFMLIAYQVPELQASLRASVKSEVMNVSGPLGFVVKAYISRDILRAALFTFAVNFLLGSLAAITLPSIIVPGGGLLVAGFRAAGWGFAGAPTFVDLSSKMPAYSFVLLLEGEGYILGLFFGLLIFVYLFRRDKESKLAHRYGKTLLMNIRGNLLVAIVLIIAAIYEAVEVIFFAM
jgi:hypothetical protein